MREMIIRRTMGTERSFAWHACKSMELRGLSQRVGWRVITRYTRNMIVLVVSVRTGFKAPKLRTFIKHGARNLIRCLSKGNTIDQLLSAPPHSEEQLWVLWDLCALSRSDSGRQALLAVGQYPEALSVLNLLIQALRSFKDLEPVGLNTDYLVDEGAECSSTSYLLLERSLEESVVELLIPSLVLLHNLLLKLQEAKEQYRNTKLLKALVRLHRELSPKLAACATDFSFQNPVSALGLCTICRLLASALACWPIFGWTPGLFHCLLESVQASSSSALGPKDACSLLYLLGDLFPEEGIWLWKNGIPSLSAVRSLSVGTILGPEGEKLINWHLQPEHLTVLLGRLTPLLDKIAQIVLHFAFTALVVLQDMLRVSCQRADCVVVLLEPIILWIDDHIKETTNLSEMDFFKSLMLKMGTMKIIEKVLERCYDACILDERLVSETRPAKSVTNMLSLCMPAFKSVESFNSW